MNSRLVRIMVCDQDLPDKIIGILFVSLITACAGILIFGILIAPNLISNADAAKYYDGAMYVIHMPPHHNATSTFWVYDQVNNQSLNTQEITPIIFADTAFYFYPNNYFNSSGSVLHDRVHYPYTDQIKAHEGVSVHGDFVWARPILTLNDNIQILNKTIIELESKIDRLEEKLGKQGKRIKQLETALISN